jgi:hypothetical protein
MKLVVSLEYGILPFVEREEYREAVTKRRVLRTILGPKAFCEIYS